MKKNILILLVPQIFPLLFFGQTVNVSYLNPTLDNGDPYMYLRFGTPTEYRAGFMWNNTSEDYGDGNDFSIFTYDDRDITLRPGTGNVIMFPMSGGNVGIGTTSPTSKLHVYKGISGGIPHRLSGITLEDDAHAMISILTPNNKYGYFGFADKDDDFVGGMEYNHITNKMALRVNNHSEGAIVIDENNNVGIGTLTPTAELEVKSVANNNAEIHINSSTDGKPSIIRFQDAGQEVWGLLANYPGTGKFSVYNYNNNTNAIVLDPNGNMGIGTVAPDSKLAVNGKIHAKEVKVDLVGWPDYVFTKEYHLPTLKEVEQHILEKGHLQNIPSAKVVEENGVLLGEMNKKLLEKIEELTLYTIAQDKQLREQQEINKTLETRLAKLEALLHKN